MVQYYFCYAHIVRVEGSGQLYRQYCRGGNDAIKSPALLRLSLMDYLGRARMLLQLTRRKAGATLLVR